MVRKEAPANAGIANQVRRKKLQAADTFLISISQARTCVSLLLTTVEIWLYKWSSLLGNHILIHLKL